MSDQHSTENAAPAEKSVGMDAGLKKRWVEALRSGEYEQGREHLFNEIENSYCCLGVLCRVLGAEFVSGHDYYDDEGDYYHYDKAAVLDGTVIGESDSEALAEGFSSAIGIPDQQALITLNDGAGKPGEGKYQAAQSFPEIADYIEQRIPTRGEA